MAEQSSEQKKPGDKPGVYFNGFSINNTLVDFQLEFSLNGSAIDNFNMSPITAKNLALQLLSVVDKYELLTGTRIESFNDLKERTQEKMKQNEELKKENDKKQKQQKDKEQKEKDDLNKENSEKK